MTRAVKFVESMTEADLKQKVSSLTHHPSLSVMTYRYNLHAMTSLCQEVVVGLGSLVEPNSSELSGYCRHICRIVCLCVRCMVLSI